MNRGLLAVRHAVVTDAKPPLRLTKIDNPFYRQAEKSDPILRQNTLVTYCDQILLFEALESTSLLEIERMRLRFLLPNTALFRQCAGRSDLQQGTMQCACAP